MPRSRVHDGVVFRRKESRVWFGERKAGSGGFVIETGTAFGEGSQDSRKTGMKPRSDSETAFRPETTTYLMS